MPHRLLRFWTAAILLCILYWDRQFAKRLRFQEAWELSLMSMDTERWWQDWRFMGIFNNASIGGCLLQRFASTARESLTIGLSSMMIDLLPRKCVRQLSISLGHMVAGYSTSRLVIGVSLMQAENCHHGRQYLTPCRGR